MSVAIAIIQVLLIIFIPLLLMKFRNKKAISFLGTIGWAYLIGILLALIMFLLNKLGINLSFNADISEYGSHIAIAVAIPLLLFSTNLKSIKALSKKSIGSFALLTASVIVVSVITGIVLSGKLDISSKLAGMAVGLYTGGTPNLNAIGSILGVDAATISYSNLADMLIGGVFYMFLLLASKPLLKKFLTAPKSTYYTAEVTVSNMDSLDGEGIDKKRLSINVLIAFGIAVLGLGIGILIWVLTGAKDGMMTSYLIPAVMITATVLGLVCSCSKNLRETKGNSLVGHYLILIFSVALAMSINFNNASINSLYIFLLFFVITVGTFLIHIILCKIFKIDVDCAIVTTTAGIYGPAFVPAVTKQLDCEELTAVGLICGSLGYAIGTFLGVGIGLLLMLIWQ